MRQFKHTDNRIFTHTGTAPHTTKDGREMILNLWETSCTHPDCLHKLIIKTATPTPENWKNFEPRKFCPMHLSFMKRREHSRLIKARAEGLRKWMASEEGKIAIKARARNNMGRVDRALYQAALDLSLTEETILWQAALTMAMARLPPPKEGQRDTRYYRVARSLSHLREKGFIKYTNGTLIILR